MLKVEFDPDDARKRIYRLRNNIVHQGKNFPETRQLVNHLHAYFIRTIHTIIHDLKMNQSWGINDVFEHRIMLYDYFKSRLKNYNCDPFPKDFILDFHNDYNCEPNSAAWSRVES